ncbi:MAG: SGNH/GDSL hydrolase family protein [Paludibacter sp.]
MLNSQAFHIPANDPNIAFRGVLYPIKSADSVVLNRHSLDFFQKTVGYFVSKKGRDQAGIVVSFKTASPTLQVDLKKRVDTEHNSPFFAVYKNHVFQGLQSTLPLKLSSGSTLPTNWDIVLPRMFGVHFTGLELEVGFTTLALEPESKKQYIAIGNSITHGTGQMNCASDATYPYILADKMGWRMYNLAVAGSKVTPLIAEQTTVIKADIITILWGFNDWNTNESMVKLGLNYKTLISKLRDYQPNAEIYCIMPITTTKSTPMYGAPIYSSIDTLRNTERRVVKSIIATGEKKMFLIEGSELTTASDLFDGIHLNNAGAASFAQKLVDVIRRNKLNSMYEKK